MQSTDEKKTEQLANKVMRLCQDELISSMPYMDRVLLSMPVVFQDPKEDPNAMLGFGTDGEKIYTVSSIVVDIYLAQRQRMNRMLFHTLLHCLFLHMYNYDQLDEEAWDLSADIAVESIILDLNLPALTIEGDALRKQVLLNLFTNQKHKNAETIYAYFLAHPRVRKQAEKYDWLFRRDRHDLWKNAKDAQLTDTNQKENWEDLKKQTDQAAEAYEMSRGLKPGTLTRVLNLHEEKKESYETLLRRFITAEEEIHPDLDTFDYVYYTYGLRLYKNMPLIEPLEYRERHGIHDFVIAIDTSGSTQGDKVKSFLEKTYAVLKSSIFQENMNVHILQCDAVVQDEVKIISQADFDAYMQELTIKGMGGTDFRPVFERIEQEVQEGEFTNLRGLLYFTDGNGTYPAAPPPFKTAFVMNEDEDIPDMPSWAVKIVM